MRILGIDTSGPHASVALAVGEEVRSEERLPAGARASREILPAVERALAAAGVGVGRVDGFAAVRGPGSFTGLRVGLATARGLALATGRPAAGFCALDLLAEQAPGAAAAACALIDAGRGEIYAGIYRRVDGGWQRSGDWRLLRPEALVEAAGAIVYLGPGSDAVRSLVEAAGGRIAPHDPWLAAQAARRLARALRAGEPPDPGTLRPLYIRPSEAERTGRWRTTRSASSA